jgi:DNA-directed RNA polymerase subunit RPC12/RpoP
MAWKGWKESVEFSCEECGEDVSGHDREDVYCNHCGYVNLYEPSDADYEDLADRRRFA